VGVGFTGGPAGLVGVGLTEDFFVELETTEELLTGGVGLPVGGDGGVGRITELLDELLEEDELLDELGLGGGVGRPVGGVQVLGLGGRVGLPDGLEKLGSGGKLGSAGKLGRTVG
jgi:hypothetical protein